MAKELDLLRVPGDPCRGECGSDPCRKRARFRKPPKLDLPVVDIELRALPAVIGGVSMSCEPRPKELVVEARSRILSRVGGCNGDDVEELRDRCESLRERLIPGSAKDKAALASATLGEGS